MGKRKLTKGRYTVDWEMDGYSLMIDVLEDKTPLEIKRMIAQKILDELGIKIRIDP